MLILWFLFYLVRNCWKSSRKRHISFNARNFQREKTVWHTLKVRKYEEMGTKHKWNQPVQVPTFTCLNLQDVSFLFYCFFLNEHFEIKFLLYFIYFLIWRSTLFLWDHGLGRRVSFTGMNFLGLWLEDNWLLIYSAF